MASAHGQAAPARVQTPSEAPPEASARRTDEIQGAVRRGLFAGVTVVFIAAVGMLASFNTPRLAIFGEINFGYVLLAGIPLVFGYLAGRPPEAIEGVAQRPPGAHNALAGAAAGLVAGLVAAVFVAFTGNVNIRSVFVNVSPVMLDTIAFGRGLFTGSVLLIIGGAVAGGVGGALNLIPKRWFRPLLGALVWLLLFGLLSSVFRQMLSGIADLTRLGFIDGLGNLIYGARGSLTLWGILIVGGVAFAGYHFLGSIESPVRQRFRDLPERSRRRWTLLGIAFAVLVVVVLPWIVGTFLSRVLVFAGIFLLMAFGLNIVVGFAGLLDLGYVAFFAVGAYTMGVLTSPISPAIAPELIFWAAIPFVMVAGALAGLMVGTPVLRMRGDYLAIVTLGFGEIARLLFLSDALTGTFGGAQGVRQVPNMSIFGFEITSSQQFFYPVLGFVLIAAYVSWALQDSRMGRAWMAMREDQSVAEVMGVNYVSAKLWAFVIGAILGSFGGALFAVNIGSVFPHSFSIVVSITVLVLIIVGGLGSLPGVVVGTLALVALPELLREFEEYRFLMYGALLIFMMLNRPEGLVPSRRRAAELHEEEREQDAWLKQEEEQQRREDAEALEGDSSG